MGRTKMPNKTSHRLMSRAVVATTALLSLLLSMEEISWAAQRLNSQQLERQVVFSEGFESDGTMSVMHANGRYEINFVGVSKERAATGVSSFKVDVTWIGGTSIDWSSVPILIPTYGNPVVRGKLYIERGAVRFGHVITVPEAGTKGSVVSGIKVGELNDGWTEWRSTSLGTPGDAAYMQAIAVFTGPPDGEGRTVFYVDDLEIEAALPDGYETELKARIAQIKVERESNLHEAALALATQFGELATEIDSVQIAFPASASAELTGYWQRLRGYRDETRSQLEIQLAKLRAKIPSAISSVRQLLARVEKAHASCRSLAAYAADYPTAPYIVWIIDPVSNEKVLPRKFPVPGIVGTELSISACPGEYEPASFALHGFKELRNVNVESSDAKSGDFILSSAQIDVRIVKCWWQAGVGVSDVRHPTLTPELLLKDSQFVRVDNETKSNTLRDFKAPRDVSELQPVTIPADETQQFWVTVHVPEGMPPGTYTGQLTLRAQNVLEMVIPFRIKVLPFKLEAPALRYSIYYRGRLAPDLAGSIGSKWKSPEQYLAEMRNLKAHGITHPTCHQDFDDTRLLDRAIELRKKAEIAVDPFYTLGLQTRAHTSPKALEALTEQVRAGLSQVRRHGIKELYIYGVDEASGEALKGERASFEAAHVAGAKVFVACWSGAFEIVGDLLNLAIYNGPLIPREARKWHNVAHSIFSYANPQVGVEEPETYRRNYGLALWKAGYDGAMNYAYQHDFGDIYNDNDHKIYRDHVFAYPTVDGVIDTIQWEGFREAVDDVRYVTTLLKTIDNAKVSDTEGALVREAERWIETIDPSRNLQALRMEMVEWTLRLRSGM